MGFILVWHTKNDECSFASVIFFVVFHEFVLGSSIRQSRILAEGLPLAGNGKFPSNETTCSHFFRDIV